MFPPTWSTENARQAAGAQSPDEDGLVLLHIAGRGDEPLQIARALEDRLRVNLLESAVQTQIAGLRAVRTVTTMRGSTGMVGLDLTWVAHRGLVYQIMGMSPANQFDRYRDVFVETALSFGPLSEMERSEIRVARLRIVRAKVGESLEQLIDRVGSAWTSAEVAVANAIQPDVRLHERQRIKIPLLEPYVAAPWSGGLSE
jgi:predicted Zn-dependent protease